jgi:hypothetical protein
MKNYLRWSLRQFYLLYFWPTQFAREVEGPLLEGPRLSIKEKIKYLFKMLPWLVLIPLFFNVVIGFISAKFWVFYFWRSTMIVMLVILLTSLAIGMVTRVAITLAFAVPFSIMFGLGVSLIDVMGSRMANSVVVSLAGGIAFRVTITMLLGLTRSRVFGLVFGMVLGVTFGLLDSTTLGKAGNMTIGVATSIAFWSSYFRLLTYPLNSSLSFLCYSAGKRRPQIIKQAWRLCPVSWNEIIWLPLPYAAKLLTMLTMQDREEGFRQIAFVAAERRLQKRVALRAVEEIAINDIRATSINQLAVVTEKLEWTTSSPAELPKILAYAFPRFERTAQHAGQYLMLHSDHRKGGALRQALAELVGLQKSLIAARGRLAPRLLQTANEWRTLLEEEQKVFAAKITETREIPNPFAFGNALGETKDNVFVGRQDLVRKIEDSILGTRQTPTLLLQGARRMGKSSILNQLPRMLGPDFAPVVIDCQEAAIKESTAATLRYLSRAISTGLQRKRVKINPLSKQALEREPFSVFKDWLEDAERDLPQALRVLLCFDEYERLQETLDAGWGHGLLDTLRNWIQHHPHLVLIFTGAHAFEELGAAWTDRFISARRMRVSFLAREDLDLLLTKPIPEFDLTYVGEALDAIIHVTSGQPFLTQAVAFELVQHLNEQRRKEASPADVEIAIARALISGSAYFANVWTDAREEGQAILTAVDLGNAPPDFPSARAWLLENDVLSPAGDFAVPMVRRWVRETKTQRMTLPHKK